MLNTVAVCGVVVPSVYWV